MNRPQIGISNLTSFTPESAREFATEGSDDDMIIKMLDEKAKLAEEEFDREFIHFQNKSARKPKLELREKAKLKAKFNKLSAENFHKEAKLRELKGSLSRMAQLTERSQSEFDEQLKNSVQDLESQCVEVESKAEDEYKQIKILKNMLSRTRLTAMIIYQRVRELERTHKKITKNFDQFIQAGFVSSNTYVVAKNQRAILQHSINNMIHKFGKASKKLKKREGDIRTHIQSSIQRVQLEEMKQKVMSKASLMEALENETQELKITKKEFSKIGKRLDFYRRNTKILQKIARRQGISVDFSVRMQDSDSHILIEIFRDLQLKEKKLNIRFQDLAFESSRKHKELERIKITLDEMKSINQFSYSKKIDTTYNILKNNDIIELSIKKQQDIQNIDALGFRVLAYLISLLSRSTFLIEVINKMTISPDRNLLAHYRAAREYLENIKTVQSFENNEAIRMNETDFSKFYLTELEAESQSRGYSSNYFSSTKKFNRLKNVLLAHFEDNRNIMTLFITFLEEDHVARSYLTTETLQNYLNNKSAEEVIKSVGSLLKIIHNEHADKIGNLANLNKDLLASAQRIFIEDFNRGTKYYLTENPEMLEKFRAEVEADKSQEFIKDPRFNSKLRKIHKSQSNDSKIIFKPIDRFGLRKSSRKPAESPAPARLTPTPLKNSTQPLFFQRRSMSNSAGGFKASLRTKNVLQEVLALDQKMQYLNFQEKKISREVKKILPLTARLPIRYLTHSATHKSPSSTRAATSRGVPMRASSLDVTQRSSSELKKRKVNKDNVI